MGEASSKSKIIIIYLNNIFAEIYNVIIYRIYTLLYNIKFNIKLLKIFYCKQNLICRDNINEAKYH